MDADDEARDQDDDLCYMPAVEIAGAYRRGELSPVEVMDAVLDRIDRLNPKVNAFVTLIAEQARAQAAEAERALSSIRADELGAMHGIPVSVKDLTPTAGVRTTFGHPLYGEHVPDEDGVIWARLKEAGAILIGKTTTPAFGENSVTESEVSGITNNPWDLTRTVGGSSGGAAAAIASGFGALATGSDGGGSIRVPSSFCGVVGLKASMGRIPVSGDASPMETVSVVGPITRTVADNAFMLSTVAGPHPYEPYALLETGVDYVAALEGATFDGLRVAYSPDLGYGRIDADVTKVVREAVDLIGGDLGADVSLVELSLPDPEQYYLDYWAPYMTGAFVEEPEIESYYEQVPLARPILEHAKGMTAGDYNHVQMVKRERLHREFADVFLRHDLLVWPTTAMVAFPHPGEVGGPTTVGGEPSSRPPFENQRLTEAIAHAGYPAITVPAGFTEDGLPVGLQIAAGHGRDVAVLRAAAAFEAARSWADRRPAFE